MLQITKSKAVVNNSADFKFKHQAVIELLKTKKADTLLLTSDQNRQWFTDFKGTFGFLFITKTKSVLLTDARYYEAACKTIKGTEVILYNSAKLVSEIAKKLKVKHLLIESEYLTYTYDALIKEISEKQTIVETKLLRAAKTAAEIEKIKKVIDITAKVGNKLPEWIKPGMTEIDLAKKITIELINAGGDKNSFDPIVASGPNGSSPHHHPTSRKMLSGDFVTCDFGTTYDGYCSDITRTWVVGNKPKNTRLINAYKTVDASNTKGIQKARAGIIGKDLDFVCRDYINQTEFAKFFVHGTGHGVGLDVHELPNVSSGYDRELMTNAVVTIEPGIYLPGIGGIRIEDMVLIKPKKSIWLSEKIKRLKL
ncbi:aminopeptidase P family protein [[Mycoplasma] testudinis]|uniref:aminopeptidase P family protein n=1 Tax=[Mycoplasma] testudinis TaxID=33924 RepID=UPI0006972E97|nr:aminopeptidase P family protein [[Mycoplasma] testudinis]